MNRLGNYGSTSVAGSRDAFHVPCVMACSRGPIEPGEPVRFLSLNPAIVVGSSRERMHGVADPFTDSMACSGMHFWVLLKPEMVASLTHSFDVVLDEDEGEDEESDRDDDDDCSSRGC